MTLLLNGSSHDFATDALSVSAMLESLGLGGRPVVVELDGEAILPAAYPATPVRDGAKVEVVTIAAGG